MHLEKQSSTGRQAYRLAMHRYRREKLSGGLSYCMGYLLFIPAMTLTMTLCVVNAICLLCLYMSLFFPGGDLIHFSCFFCLSVLLNLLLGAIAYASSRHIDRQEARIEQAEQYRPSPELLTDRDEEILVRGASAPTSPTEILLRAASSRQETEPEQMLRASEKT
jgi:hypothetical protein